MSEHLQLQLRDLGDQISKIESNHSRLQAVAEESVLGRLRGATGLLRETVGERARRDELAESSTDTIDRDIAEVEKMLQQWLVAHGKKA